jgi:predicted permease
MDLLIGSIRYAVRQFWMSRLFTAAVVLTLALGIGGTTAIFTLIDAVMLRSLPVSDPSRLYRIGDGDDTTAKGRHGRWGIFSFPLYERLKAVTPEFEDITAFDWGGTLFSVRRQGTGDAAKPLRGEYATGTYFSTLGVGAFAGRVFAADDDRLSASPVVVLSHHAWQETYGADPSAVGSTFVVEGHPFSVIGVAPPGFFGATVRSDPPDIWIPLQQEPIIAGRGSLLKQSVSPWLFVVGRLRPGASIAGMAPRLTEILRQWIRYDAGYPSNWMPDILRDLPKQTVAVIPAGAGIGLAGLSAKEQYGSSLQILFALCSLVLVMACANVANLLLGRAVARRTQTAVRLAIGATRGQIITESLTESVLLAIAGGLAGLLVAIGAARLLIALAFRSAHFVPITTTPSLVVLAFAIGLALVTGIVFGAVPAWWATRTDPIDALRGSGRSSSNQASRARTALLMVQATLSVVLVAGATMLARSLANLQQQDFGYSAQGRVVVGLKRLPATYNLERLSALYRDIEQRLALLPGVRGSGLALYNPLGPSNWGDTVLVASHPPNAIAESNASWDRVSADYLQNLGIALVRGRVLTVADNERTAPVAVVNEAFVKRFFKGNEDPLDQQFGIERPENASTFRIVGVVRDAKFAWSGLDKPARPMFYVPLVQQVDYHEDQLRLVERLSHLIQGILLVTDSPLGELEPRLRRTLADADPNLTVTSVRTMQQQIDVSLDRESEVASLAGLFGMVALVLAAVGVYGVTTYMVAQQTNEIGIRMALGADRAKVIQLVLGRAFQRVAAGLVVGVPLAVGAARLMGTQLYGVASWDPVALTVAAGSLAGCAFFAAIIPAGRAAAISPMIALRSE